MSKSHTTREFHLIRWLEDIVSVFQGDLTVAFLQAITVYLHVILGLSLISYETP